MNMRFPEQNSVRVSESRWRRLLALVSEFVWPPLRGFSRLRQLTAGAARDATAAIREYCIQLESEKRIRAFSSSVLIDSRSVPYANGYVIAAPPFEPVSAGICCLYRLCDELNRRGFRSYIAGSRKTAPHLAAPLISWEAGMALCRRGYIAVYPETVIGNPLRAGCVARWVLNRPGLLGGEMVYGGSEMVFYYSEAYRPYIANRVAGKIYMPTIDEEIFFCDDGDLSRRSLECFYVGKSHCKEGIFDRRRAFEITRRTPPKRELGNLFRASRLLYCFDNSTILIFEALMCGCPVVVIPDGTQTKGDFEQLELGMSGIAWGPEELPGLTVDLPKLRERYQRVKRDFQTQLDAFVAITQAGQSDSRQRRAA
jgi:hypothetical protein